MSLDTPRERGGSPRDGVRDGGRRLRRKVVLSALSVLIFFGLVEAALRIAGWPEGKYRFMFDRNQLLYEPSTRIEARVGPIAYTIETNSLGMRSDEIGVAKPPGVVRIAAVGDSATDGFFVDNDKTYPAILQRTLRARGHAVEVMNAGKGGASIGQELHVLRGITHLSPDVAVLTFCTNDIAELQGQDQDRLGAPDRGGDSPSDAIIRGLIGYTAIGEFVLDAWIRVRSRAENPAAAAASRQVPDAVAIAGLPPNYRFPGGDAFAQNVESFRVRFGETDGLVLGAEFPPDVEASVDRYFRLLEQVLDHCRRHGIELVLSYLPAYPEVYDLSSPMTMRDRLDRWCAEAGVPFLDLTPTLRERGRRTPLHLTPADFHPNPLGNQVIAEAVADFLETHYARLLPS